MQVVLVIVMSVTKLSFQHYHYHRHPLLQADHSHLYDDDSSYGAGPVDVLENGL